MKKKIFRYLWLWLDIRTRTAVYEALDYYCHNMPNDSQWQTLKRKDAKELKDYLIKP